MMGQKIYVPMNRQQLELLDRTLARWPGMTRAEILQRALREYAARRASAGAPVPGRAS